MQSAITLLLVKVRDLIDDEDGGSTFSIVVVVASTCLIFP
jgi:hypothetical protein